MSETLLSANYSIETLLSAKFWIEELGNLEMLEENLEVEAVLCAPLFPFLIQLHWGLLVCQNFRQEF